MLKLTTIIYSCFAFQILEVNGANMNYDATFQDISSLSLNLDSPRILPGV